MVIKKEHIVNGYKFWKETESDMWYKSRYTYIIMEMLIKNKNIIKIKNEQFYNNEGKPFKYYLVKHITEESQTVTICHLLVNKKESVRTFKSLNKRLHKSDYLIDEKFPKNNSKLYLQT